MEPLHRPARDWSRSWRSPGCSRAHKRAIKLRILLWGLGLQFGFALLVLKTDFGKLFQAASVGVTAMLGYAEAGSAFVFGDTLGSSERFHWARSSRFRFCPIIIFIASFFSILYYLGIMQWIVKGFRDRDAESDGRERRGIAQCRGQHLHGADGSASHHPAFHRRPDGIRAVHHHGQRHGACFGRGDGGLREIRACGDPASADGGDHDRAGHDHAGEDFRARKSTSLSLPARWRSKIEKTA